MKKKREADNEITAEDKSLCRELNNRLEKRNKNREKKNTEGDIGEEKEKRV